VQTELTKLAKLKETLTIKLSKSYKSSSTDFMMLEQPSTK